VSFTFCPKEGLFFSAKWINFCKNFDLDTLTRNLIIAGTAFKFNKDDFQSLTASKDGLILVTKKVVLNLL